jgi:hypothetical protein
LPPAPRPRAPPARARVTEFPCGFRSPPPQGAAVAVLIPATALAHTRQRMSLFH